MRARAPRIASSLAMSLTAALTCLPGGCTSPPSSVVVVVSSDFDLDTEVDNIVYEYEHGTSIGIEDFPIDSISLPGTLVVQDEDDDIPASTPFRLSVSFTRDDATLVSRTVSSSMLEGDQRMVFLHLSYACLDRDPCRFDETCVAGRCRPHLVDVESQPVFDIDKVLPRSGNSASSDPCFDDASAFSAPTSVPPADLTLSGNDCTLPLPPSPKGAVDRDKINVAIVWARQQRPERAFVLDRESSPYEGWSLSADASTIQLAPGYCDRTQASSPAATYVSRVLVSFDTLSKSRLLPLCKAPGTRPGFAPPATPSSG